MFFVDDDFVFVVLLDKDDESGRLLVYDDSRSMLVDMPPLTEQNIESDGSERQRNETEVSLPEASP